MAPSTTIGAVILLWRKADEGDRLPCVQADAADHPTPLGARPRSRTMFVLTAVSSINTSRAGQTCLAPHPTSARARHICSRRSAACRLFFTVMLCRSRNRESELRLVLRRLRNSSNRLQQSRSLPAIRAKPRPQTLPAAKRSAARLRRGALPRRQRAATLPPTPRHLETFGRLASRRARFHSFDNAFPQVTKIGFGNQPP